MNSSIQKCFIYDWFIDEKEVNVTSIRIYGINQEGKNICLRVNNFTPYVYIELPDNIRWNNGKAQLVCNKINNILGEYRPLKKSLVMKYKLYGAEYDINGNKKKFPYLICTFSSKKDITKLYYGLTKSINIPSIGLIKLKIHESDADPILQFTTAAKINTVGWVNFRGNKCSELNKLTLCDEEYIVQWKNIINDEKTQTIVYPKILGYDIEVYSSNPNRMPQAENPEDKIFQISCVINRVGDDEKSYRKYLLTLGETDDSIGNDINVQTYKTEADLLVGFAKFIRDENPNIITGYNIMGFDYPYMIDRAKLTMCFDEFDMQSFSKTSHCKEKEIAWSSSAYKNQSFKYLETEGRLVIDLHSVVRRDFKFNNYKLKTVSEHFIGKTKDDLSPKGIFKCYDVGMTKKNGKYTKSAKKAMSICGKYCVQDSVLVNLLMEKLQTWIGVSEMGKTWCVPITYIYTKGQQIKVFSQVYKYCTSENIVVEKDGYTCQENERYTGAHVFLPVPGGYKNVVPFDFSSLYPTTIIAYNIDYHTWVPDNSSIPNSKCHVMEWEDHIGCNHDPKIIRKKELDNYISSKTDKIKNLREQKVSLRGKGYSKLTIDKKTKELTETINKLKEQISPYIKERSELSKTIPSKVMCEKRRYRFLKKPKGVIPTIIENLLNARSKTRKVDMKKVKEDILKEEQKGNCKKVTELNSLLNVLNQRQLSYKVSANSMYGAMGVRRGYLPFMPGAMCTTFMGRENIKLTAEKLVKDFQGELIYGDTDSNYIYFPTMQNKSYDELWNYSEYVAAEISKCFPSPIKLEFEEEIYSFFFILTKKRYMYRKVFKKGSEIQTSNDIGKKGVLLARRDNSKFVRDIYEEVIGLIADCKTKSQIMNTVYLRINEMMSGNISSTNFVITKSVGDYGNMKPVLFTNEKNIQKAKIGQYTTPVLSSDEKLREKQLKDKKAKDEDEFYLKCLPAQVQLAYRMRKRGTRVDTGSRLEYIVCYPENHNGKQYDKIEDYDYQKKFGKIVKIDFYYYLKALSTPLDQLLNVAFGNDIKWKKDPIKELYNHLSKKRQNMMNELENIFSPEIIINEK